jgi:hypothetical protein
MEAGLVENSHRVFLAFRAAQKKSMTIHHTFFSLPVPFLMGRIFQEAKRRFAPRG